LEIKMQNQNMFPPPMMYPGPMMGQGPMPNQRQMPVVVQAAFKYLEHVHNVEDNEYVGVPGTDTQAGSVETMKGRKLNGDEERAKVRALECLQTYLSGDLPAEEENPDRPLQLLIDHRVAAELLHNEMKKKAQEEGVPPPDWIVGLGPPPPTDNT